MYNSKYSVPKEKVKELIPYLCNRQDVWFIYLIYELLSLDISAKEKLKPLRVSCYSEDEHLRFFKCMIPYKVYTNIFGPINQQTYSHWMGATNHYKVGDLSGIKFQKKHR